MKHPSVPLFAQDALVLGPSWTNTLQPAGDVGVLMQLKCPQIVVWAETNGFTFDGRSMFRVSSVCWIDRSQASFGWVGSVMFLMDVKWAFASCIVCSAGSCP